MNVHKTKSSSKLTCFRKNSQNSPHWISEIFWPTNIVFIIIKQTYLKFCLKFQIKETCFRLPWRSVTDHLGRSHTDATRLRFDQEKKSTTLISWRVVIASWSRWWEKRRYELKVRPVGDCKVIFSWSNRSRVASAGERPSWFIRNCL
jgi:hypothetical protein